MSPLRLELFRHRSVADAIVVVYEEATLVVGCAVVSRWECVVPATSR
jgi:hypothetical protein